MAKHLPINLHELLQLVGSEFQEQILILNAKDRYDAIVSPVEFLDERFGRTRIPPKYTVTEVVSNNPQALQQWMCRLHVGPFHVSEMRMTQQKSKFEAALHFAVEFMQYVDLFKSPKPETLYFDRETIGWLVDGRNAEAFLRQMFKYTKTPLKYWPTDDRRRIKTERLGTRYFQEIHVGIRKARIRAFTVEEGKRQAAILMLHNLGFIEHYSGPVDDGRELVGIPQVMESEMTNMLYELRNKCKERHEPFMVEFTAIKGMDTQCRIFAMRDRAVGSGAGNRSAELAAAKKILAKCGYANKIAELEEKCRSVQDKSPVPIESQVPVSQHESSTTPEPEVPSEPQEPPESVELAIESSVLPTEKSEVAAEAAECSKAEVESYRWSCKIIIGKESVVVHDRSDKVKHKAANRMLLAIKYFHPWTIDQVDYLGANINGDKRPEASLTLIGEMNNRKLKKEVVKKMLEMAGYLDESIFERIIEDKNIKKDKGKEKVGKKPEAPLKDEVDEVEGAPNTGGILKSIMNVVKLVSLTGTEPEEVKTETKNTEEKPNFSHAGKVSCMNSVSNQIQSRAFLEKFCAESNIGIKYSLVDLEDDYEEFDIGVVLELSIDPKVVFVGKGRTVHVACSKAVEQALIYLQYKKKVNAGAIRKYLDQFQIE